MIKHEGVDKFGHSGYSMAQTVFITQQIIKKGLGGTADFYKKRHPRHPLVSKDDVDDVDS